MNREAKTLLPVLLARRSEFVGFLATRLNHNHADAEDVFQNSLVKALAAAGTLRDEDRLVPWFYQLLRHALIDHIRSRRTTADRDHRWTEETLPATAVTTHLCACLEPLIATLSPAQATLVRRAELGNEPVATVAASIGLSPNAASVALHRARAVLRGKLQSFCGDCASGACLDCDCE
jgi:RNA polymerase sigma-70 factor (ECF subfamily)